MSDKEKLAADLQRLCEDYDLTLFLESNQTTGSVCYHLLTRADAWAQILDSWQSSARMH